jgi:hypothetical protein
VYRIVRTGQPGQDSRVRTSGTAHPGQDSQKGDVRSGQPEWDKQNGTAEDGMQAGLPRQAEMPYRRGLPGQDCPYRTALKD